MADGSARRGVKAPGYLDDAAAPFDAAVATALADGDAAALAALDPAEGERLLAAGVPVWRAVGAALAGRASPRGCTPTTRRSASATSWPTGTSRDRRRRSSPSSGRPRPARPRWPWRWRGGSAARWSTPTPCSSTAAWTSARPSPTPPSAAACRTTCSTCGTCASRRPWPSTGERARAEIDRLRAAGVVPLLVGGSGLYVRAVLDELDFPGTDAAVRARLEAELAAVGAGGAARAAGRRRPGGGGGGPAQQRTADRAGAGGRRADRRPVPRHAARAAAALPGRRRRARPGPGRARRADRARGWTGCGPPGLVAEVEALAADGLREGPTASRALGYAQVLAQLDGDADRRTRRGSATVAHHPPVRAPAAVLVPPRPGHHLARRGAARPARRRRRA